MIADIKVDPTGSYIGVPHRGILGSLGILPFFAIDVALSSPESVQEAFDMLMEAYGTGFGQDGSGWGTVDPETLMYKSAHEEYLRSGMAPLASIALTEDIQFLVYQYAICAVTDGTTTLMMRMD